ncbi:hypothetical protein KUCAC02_028100, partial [Chaenocephalus aceratus]
VKSSSVLKSAERPPGFVFVQEQVEGVRRVPLCCCLPAPTAVVRCRERRVRSVLPDNCCQACTAS